MSYFSAPGETPGAVFVSRTFVWVIRKKKDFSF